MNHLRQYLSANLLIAVTINASMGILYVWSLFLLPMESHLQIARSSVSLVPAFALVTFTAAMMVHAHVLRRLGPVLSTALAFVLAAGGHLLFAVHAEAWVLLIGYGIGFGFGAGLGYGIALSLVARTEDSVRAISIGIVMSAFAMTGVILPIVAGPFFRHSDPGLSFSAIGAVLSLTGLLVVISLWSRAGNPTALAASSEPAGSPQPFRYVQVKFGMIFFLLCYVGLTAVSHVTGVLASNGLAARIIDLGPTTLTAGYLLGSLVGGGLVERTGNARAIVIVSIVCGAGTILADSSSAAMALLGVSFIGFTFGSTASVFPTIISVLYGPEQIGPMFGRMMVAYGIAGLSAPWISGVLFEIYNDYSPAILTGLVMCVLAASLGATVRQSVRPSH